MALSVYSTARTGGGFTSIHFLPLRDAWTCMSACGRGSFIRHECVIAWLPAHLDSGVRVITEATPIEVSLMAGSSVARLPGTEVSLELACDTGRDTVSEATSRAQRESCAASAAGRPSRGARDYVATSRPPITYRARPQCGRQRRGRRNHATVPRLRVAFLHLGKRDRLVKRSRVGDATPLSGVPPHAPREHERWCRTMSGTWAASVAIEAEWVGRMRTTRWPIAADDASRRTISPLRDVGFDSSDGPKPYGPFQDHVRRAPEQKRRIRWRQHRLCVSTASDVPYRSTARDLRRCASNWSITRSRVSE